MVLYQRHSSTTSSGGSSGPAIALTVCRARVSLPSALRTIMAECRLAGGRVDTEHEAARPRGWVLGALEDYLSDLRDVRLSGEGVSELSYYPALRQLLEAVGGGLKPKVRCFMNLKNEGAGMPDGGLFTADQVRKAGIGGQKPARGAIEVKPPSADAATVAASEQVRGYLQAYRQVLVTTLREFLLPGIDEYGKTTVLERCSLAPTEAEFWALTRHPRRAEQEQGERFMEFLKRVLLSGATLASPQDLAWFLASYAREARFLVEAADLPALDAFRKALEDALGVKFEGAKGEHFFRSTLVQTLFYGVFASWVMWSHEHEPDDGAAAGAPGAPGRAEARFDWKIAAWTLRVPVIQTLFTEIATPSRLGPLGLAPVLDLAAAALNRVDRRAFFARFEQHHAVQYFYEPFLEAFDPELRKELGVWYTPPEIVEYMVARVDTVLREELDVPDGLADPRVYVLDPCCGTGAYLVEVLEKIAQTLDEKGADALSAGDVKKAALERVFGFEILPAPFVIAHMQLGLLLQNMHLPLGDHERVGVFLTNALTGWESPHQHQQLSVLPELEAERDAAERVKQELPILVILGNPPYNGYAGMATAEERTLTEAYRTTKKAPAPQGQGLNDLYVRFFRMAERRIVEKTGKGIVCFISNYSWLDGLSFTGMRERYLEVFDKIWIDCLNGDKYKTGKLTPEGKPDPSVFSTEHNREGIQVGTAVALLARKQRHQSTEEVRATEFWGVQKRAELEALAMGRLVADYRTVSPNLTLGLPFLVAGVEADYESWPTLPGLFPVSYPGVKTSRDELVVDVDRERLVSRMQAYFNPDLSDEEMRQIAPLALTDAPGFNARATRSELLRRGFLQDNVIRYWYRPFDLRWLYWEPQTKLLDRNRADYFAQLFRENIWLFTTGRTRKERPEPPLVTRGLIDLNFMDSGARGTPALLSPEINLLHEFDTTAPTANLTGLARGYVGSFGISSVELLLHASAVIQSNEYRTANKAGLRHDWPRIPLPNSKELLLASAELGRKVADLLDPETEVDGVTSGSLRPELRVVGVASRVDGGNLNPQAGDLAVTAAWGHAGQGGVTMPGKGKTVTRPWTSEERTAIEQGAEALGLSAQEAFAQLGDTAVDVFLNDVAYWRGVPSGVWSYTIGGYQVMKKWLSYREKPLLGRDLKTEEVREVTRMARRIAAILLLQPALDANYRAVKENTFAWKPEKG